MSPRAWFLFALMSLIWGIPYLLIKVAVDGVSVPVLVFARTAAGALLLLPFALSRLGALRGHGRPLLAFAACEIIGPWWLLSDAERHLSSSMAGLLIAAVPIVAVLLARLTGDRERLGALRWTGLAAGLAGVAVLAAPQVNGGSPWAVTEVLLTALGYAAAPLIAARHLRDVPTLPLTAGCLAVAAACYAVPAAATWPARMPDAEVLAALAGLGVICTAFGFLVFFELIREAGASRAMVFTYVNPAVAVAAGVTFLGEPLTGTVLAAFVLILCGSVLATGRLDRTADEPAGRSRRDLHDPAEERPGSTGQGGR
ncbi:putative inner membrane transporter YedA [Streptomyces sp. MP131-18]|nr:putative inner membrane transporter YedA [Streptomyces sp. MP131-18]